MRVCVCACEFCVAYLGAGLCVCAWVSESCVAYVPPRGCACVRVWTSEQCVAYQIGHIFENEGARLGHRQHAHDLKKL